MVSQILTTPNSHGPSWSALRHGRPSGRGSSHRRNRLVDLPRVHEDLERIEVLVLLDELQIRQTVQCVQSFAARQTRAGPAQGLGSEFMPAVGNHALG